MGSNRPASVSTAGDLTDLSRRVRAILDDGGLTGTEIIASGDLGRGAGRRALVAVGAPIDRFGVGTALSTSSDAPALGGVYKLVEVERGGVAAPTIKLSQGKRFHPGPEADLAASGGRGRRGRPARHQPGGRTPTASSACSSR